MVLRGSKGSDRIDGFQPGSVAVDRTAQGGQKVKAIVRILFASIVIGAATSGAARQDDLFAIEQRHREFYAAGDYTGAIVEKKRAEAVVKTRVAANQDTAKTLNNLAVRYLNQGKYAEAAELYQHALAIEEKALGPSHPNVATVLNNLGIVYQAQGKYAEAEELYKRAIAIYAKTRGPNHPMCITHKANMPRRKSSTSAHSPLRRTRSARATPMWPRASITSVIFTKLKANMPRQRSS
jgi:tetratricopeptide (TPR) repeat protein